MRIVAATALALLLADAASAACVNRFVARSEKNQQTVTLLTGKLTFQEAQELAKKISAGEAPHFEWVNESGKPIGKQIGDLKVVRPMPVGCDGKTSGVVIIASFFAVHPPSKVMHVKINADTTVAFEQQAD